MVTKLAPTTRTLSSLHDPNGLGVYQRKMLGGYLFTFQDPMIAPPEMPTTYANNSRWSKLCKVNEKLVLARSMEKMQSSEHRENNYDQHVK
jgi:hypothetical protein